MYWQINKKTFRKYVYSTVFHARFEVLVLIGIKIVVRPCSPVHRHRHLGGNLISLHQTTRSHILENRDLAHFYKTS